MLPWPTYTHTHARTHTRAVVIFLSPSHFLGSSYFSIFTNFNLEVLGRLKALLPASSGLIDCTQDATRILDLNPHHTDTHTHAQAFVLLRSVGFSGYSCCRRTQLHSISINVALSNKRIYINSLWDRAPTAINVHTHTHARTDTQ